MSPVSSAAAAGQLVLGGELTVNRLGFGAMRITGQGIWGEPPDRRVACQVLRRVVELGVTFIDTADSYGPAVSELLIAEALHPYPEGLVIATKGGLLRPGPDRWQHDARPQRLREACEGSLRRLRLERIDLYQLHAPDRRVPLEDSIGELVRLKTEGKIRLIGVSNFTTEELTRAQRIARIVSVQNRYNLLDRSSEAMLARCQKDGLAFLPWAPLDSGRHAVHSKSWAISPAARVGRALQRVAQRHQVATADVSLAWLLQRSPVTLPIPGTASPQHAEANIASAMLRLTPEDLRELR
jgi:aryl-alcohol dehydrogenase-like predicted oxidoreductase